MRKLLRLLAAGLLLTLALSTPSWAADAQGDWLGSLAVSPALNLRIAVHIRKSRKAPIPPPGTASIRACSTRRSPTWP
jgi:hypothetical protein